jgi:hypothetical protein
MSAGSHQAKVLVASILVLSAAAIALGGCLKRSLITTPGGIVLRSQRISLPAHGREFSGGPQSSVANTYCLMCHSGGMVMTQPPMSVAQWQAELQKMIKIYACPLPQGDIDGLAPFIAQASQNSSSLSPRAAK